MGNDEHGELVHCAFVVELIDEALLKQQLQVERVLDLYVFLGVPILQLVVSLPLVVCTNFVYTDSLRGSTNIHNSVIKVCPLLTKLMKIKQC